MISESNDWEQLISYNIEFLKGKKASTWFTSGIHEETTLIFDELVEMNKKGWYTVESQPCVDSSYLQQRGYIEFFTKDSFDKIQNILEKEEEIYFEIHTDTQSFSNIPNNLYKLTRVFEDGEWKFTTAFEKGGSSRKSYISLFPSSIKILLEKSTYGFVVNREFHSDPKHLLNKLLKLQSIYNSM